MTKGQEIARAYSDPAIGGFTGEADLAVLIDKVLSDAYESSAKIAENFDDWERCGCDECRYESRAHAVDQGKSLDNLAAEIRSSTDQCTSSPSPR